MKSYNSFSCPNTIRPKCAFLYFEIVHFFYLLIIALLCISDAYGVDHGTPHFEALSNMDYTGVQDAGVEQTDTITDLDALIKKNIVDAVNEIVPIAIEKYLDANIDRVVERAVSAAVDKSFAMNFARLTAMTGVMKNTETEVDVRAEQHALIDTEKQLDDWNTDLAQDAVRKKYVSKIILKFSFG